MQAFLDHCPSGTAETRDVDLAGCSHQLDETFHQVWVPELCRLTRDVRVFHC